MLLSTSTPCIMLSKLKSICLLTITLLLTTCSITFVQTSPAQYHRTSLPSGDIFTASNMIHGVPSALSDEPASIQDNSAINFLLPNDEDILNSAPISSASSSASALSKPEIGERELNLLTNILLQILEEPWRDDQLPLLYVEDYPPPSTNQISGDSDIEILDDDLVGNAMKRSRYYRKYPWKRQNSRYRTYDSENKYMCQPSREDVYQLLLALHESRQGNRNRTVNFCNRRRPAAAIYTNIRFLGRR